MCCPADPGHKLCSGDGHARVVRRGSRDVRRIRGIRREEIARPLPDVAGHVVQARSRWAGSDSPETCPRTRQSAGSARGTRPARCWPSSDPWARTRLPTRRSRPPAHRGREFPLRLGGQLLAGPGRISLSVFVGDVRNRMAAHGPEGSLFGALRPPPRGPRGRMPTTGGNRPGARGPCVPWNTSAPGTRSAGVGFRVGGWGRAAARRASGSRWPSRIHGGSV